MKNSIFFLTIIAVCVIIVFSHIHYKQKLESIAAEATYRAETQTAFAQEENSTNEEADDKEADQAYEVTGLAKTWAENVANDEALHVAFFGSISLTHGVDPEHSWPSLFASELQAKLPQLDIATTIVDVEREVSTNVIQGDYLVEVIESRPSVLFIEPFLLNDNGNVRIEDSLANLTTIIEQVKEALPEVELVILPANPLYEANFYFDQNKELANYAEEKDFYYLNHWGAWPATDNEELNNYLDNGRPNKEGHELWAKYVAEDILYDN